MKVLRSCALVVAAFVACVDDAPNKAETHKNPNANHTRADEMNWKMRIDVILSAE